MNAAAAGVAIMLPMVAASVLRTNPVTVLRAGLAKATPTMSPLTARLTTETRRAPTTATPSVPHQRPLTSWRERRSARQGPTPSTSSTGTATVKAT